MTVRTARTFSVVGTIMAMSLGYFGAKYALIWFSDAGLTFQVCLIGSFVLMFGFLGFRLCRAILRAVFPLPPVGNS